MQPEDGMWEALRDIYGALATAVRLNEAEVLALLKQEAWIWTGTAFVKYVRAFVFCVCCHLTVTHYVINLISVWY